VATRRPPNCVIKLFEMLYLFLPTELRGSVPVLITRRHGAIFLLRKESYFLFSVALQYGFLNNITWNKFMHKCETIIAHHFGTLLLTKVFVALCIIVAIGNKEGTKLILTSEKAAPLLKRLTVVRWSYKEPFISLSTTTIQNFILVYTMNHCWKNLLRGLIVAGTPDCMSYIINADMVMAYSK